MATHCSILALEIPWTEEPGRLQFMGLQRVRHSLATEYQQRLQLLIYAETFTQVISQSSQKPYQPTYKRPCK